MNLSPAEIEALETHLGGIWECSDHTAARLWTRALAQAYPEHTTWREAQEALMADGARGSTAFFREDFDLRGAWTSYVARIRESVQAPEDKFSWLDYAFRDPVLLSAVEKVLALL